MGSHRLNGAWWRKTVVNVAHPVNRWTAAFTTVMGIGLAVAGAFDTETRILGVVSGVLIVAMSAAFFAASVIAGHHAAGRSLEGEDQC